MQKGSETRITGKLGELKAFVKLLEEGLVPYVPLVDEGVDCMLRNGKRIQIKTVKTQRDPRWFQVRDLKPEDDLYIIGIDAKGEFWISPSKVFADNATKSGGIYDLDLDAKGRSEHLKDYKGAWHLLKNQANKKPHT